jgi:hypothetical protein
VGLHARITQLGVVRGRADDVRIVNSANVSRDTLRHASELADIQPMIHYLKHDSDDDINADELSWDGAHPLSERRIL